MDFKIILSGKEKVQILDRGFRLKLNKGPQGPNRKSYFTCVHSGCKARAGTEGELTLGGLTLVYHHVEQHTHHADFSKNLVAEKLYQFRSEAKENPDKTAKSVYEKLASEAINGVSTPDKQNVALHLPKFESVKDQHYRQRKKQRPNLPKTLKDVNIESYTNLTTTERGKPFYRGKTESGVELFMSDTQVEAALLSDTLFIDGTFSIAPEPFFQVVFLRGKVGENRFTLATALLPNKQEQTYVDMLMKVVETCEIDSEGNEGRSLNFEFAHSDCELGIVNAEKRVFPTCKPKSCRFHVVDAIRRFANNCGLRKVIKQRPDFKRFYGRIRQIFFYPPRLWPRVWKILLDQLEDDTKDLPEVQRFLTYMVRTF